MRKITNAKCSACGASLRIHENDLTVTCEYCGSQFTLQDDDNVPSIQTSKNIETAVSELAIRRLREELTELEPQKQKKIKELDIWKEQKISEIEKKKNESLSSPTIENLKQELNSLKNERAAALIKEKTRLGFLTTLITSMGLVGGCLVFLLVGVITFFSSAIIAAILEVVTPISISSDQALKFIFWVSFIVAVIFIIWFTRFSKAKKEKLSQESTTRRSQLENAIAEKENKINTEMSYHANRVNQDAESQKEKIVIEMEMKKASIEKEILERQEQLDKHYKRAKI